MSATTRRIWTERLSIARFLTTGVLGALLNVGLFALFARGLDVDYRIAVVLAFAFSYVFSFVSHRTWTFSATDGHVGHQGVRFVVVSAVSIICAVLVTVAAVEALGLPKNVGEAASALLTAPVTFVLHRRYTFGGVAAAPREPAPTAAPAPELI